MCLKLDHWSRILHACVKEIEIGHAGDSFREKAVVIW